MAQILATRMAENGCLPEAHFFDGEDHIFRTSARNREAELLIAFFGRHLATAQNGRAALISFT